MKRFLSLLPVIGWLALLAPAAAQVSVSLQLEQESVLLYEPVIAQVTLRNLGSQPIKLGENQAKPWLTFRITDSAGRLIQPLDDGVREQVLLRPGGAVTRAIEALPLYDIREPGTYRLRAVVDAGAARVESATSRLTVLTGNVVWSQTVDLPTAAGQPSARRTYSLLVKHGGQHLQLYGRVADNDAALIYGMLALGTFVPMGQPQASIDRDGRLHVLFRSGSRAFQYRAINPSGAFDAQAGYSSLQSEPELVVYADGSIKVQGGLQVYPRRETPAGPSVPVQPPEPPPAKSWWKFWGK